MNRNLLNCLMITVVISVPISLLVAFAAAQSQQSPTMPANQLLCTTFKPGTVYAYTMTATGEKKAGTYAITSGRHCQWTFPSESDDANGTTQTWTNPPTSLITTAGNPVYLPGADELLFIPAGSKVKVNQ